jgi:ApeA N-terminal domain 1
VRERRLEGQWWLPERPEEKVAGIVEYDGVDEPKLRLLGVFTTWDQRSEDAVQVESGLGDEEIPLILGRCDGELVSLLHCHETNFTLKMTGREDWRQGFRARLMLVGIGLDRPDEEYFDQIVISIDHLLAWSQQSGLDQDYGLDNGRFTSVTMGWTQVGTLAAEMPTAVVELRVDFATDKTEWVDRTDQTIKERARFIVTVPDPKDARSLIDTWVKPLQDLVTFGVGRPCGVHDIHLIRRSPPALDSGTPLSHSVAVDAHLSPIYASKLDEKAISHHRALFTLGQVNFAELLPVWLSLMERLGPVVSMLLGSEYIGRSYAENRLITAVAAAEAMHRRLLANETAMTVEEFETLRAAALDAAPLQHRDWLNNRIWNEPSLKQRLMQLVQRVGEDLVQPAIPRPNRWAAATKEARNKLVHRFPEEDTSVPLNGAVMYVLARMTSAVITLNILQEIGVDRAHMENLVMTHDVFRWIADEGRRIAPRLF